MDQGIIILLVLVSIIGGGVAGYILRKRLSEKDINAVRAQAERTLRDAQKEAERIKAEADSRLKDELYQTKQRLEREARERRNELQRIERRLLQREENFEKKAELLDNKEMDLLKKERELAHAEKEIKEKEQTYNELLEREKKELERISSMSAEEAKRHLIEFMEQEARHDAAKMIRRIEEEAKETGDRKAQEIISLAIQRYAGEYVAERTVSIVNLPNDEMKGRIIGREGRNIRAIEAATGIDLIVDDTPEAVIISSMNPVRREIAKVALERLIADGRIHPGRIEEIVDKVEKEIEAEMKKAGEQAIFDVGIHNIHPDLVRLIGKLKFRTSYAQNCYIHSLEVAFMCGIMAAELGLNEKQAKRAGLLHDIGKAMDHEVEGSHAGIGAELLKKYGESDRIVVAVATHHNDRPDSILGILIQAADALSAARPGARREMWETYIKRVKGLENIALSYSGVEKAYAIQAGRELRVIVGSKKVSDDEMVMLSRDITKRIEKELTYPGQIKVTVIRETRAVDYAK